MTAIAFQTNLKSDTVHLPDVKSLIGKDVIITVVEIEVEPKKKPKREWKFSGNLDFNGALDNVNIRDIAYE